MNTSRAALALALVLLLGAVAPALGAVGGTSTTADTAPPNASEANQEYDLEELQDTGKIIDTRYPSMRKAGPYTTFWFNRYPPSGMNQFQGDNANTKALPSDAVVRRNRLEMVASHPYDGETRRYNLTLIYWNPDTREVRDENGNITEERYANITGVSQQEVTFEQGMKRTEVVNLKGHYDTRTNVMLLIHTPEGVLKIPFKHESIATAQPVNIGSTAELYSWAWWWLIAPSIGLSWLVQKKAKSFRENADAPPGYPAGALIGIMVVVFAAIFVGAYAKWATLVAALPVVFAGIVAAVVGINEITHKGGDVEHWGLIRMDPESASSPLDDGEALLDSADIEVEGYDVISTDDGPALYHRGFQSMYARAKGYYAPLTVENREAEFNGVGEYDKVIVVAEGEGDLVESESERVIWAFPWRTYTPPEDIESEDTTDEHPDYDPALDEHLPRELGKPQYIQILGFLGVPAIAGYATHTYLGSAVWGVLACTPLVWRFAKPAGGWAWTQVAPGQSRKAFVTAWYASVKMKQFASVDAMAKQLVQTLRSKNDMGDWMSALNDEGLIEGAHDDDSNPFSEDIVEAVDTEEGPSVGEARRAARGEADD